MTLSYKNAVAVAEIAFYIPVFFIGVYLMIRHGWTKSTGWLFLTTFAVARTIGGAMQLATISDPKNVSLHIGAAVLANIGLSPLLLSSLGLIDRVRYSIHKTRKTMVNSRILRLTELMTIVAVILSIVGATSIPNSTFEGKTALEIPTTMTAGAALYIVAYAIIALAAFCLCLNIHHVESGEKRLLLALALSLPFLFVRLLYNCLSVLGQVSGFSFADRNTTIFLCMALVMEAVVVVLYQGTGLTLRRLPPEDKAQIHAERRPKNHQGYKGFRLLNLAREAVGPQDRGISH